MRIGLKVNAIHWRNLIGLAQLRNCRVPLHNTIASCSSSEPSDSNEWTNLVGLDFLHLQWKYLSSYLPDLELFFGQWCVRMLVKKASEQQEKRRQDKKNLTKEEDWKVNIAFCGHEKHNIASDHSKKQMSYITNSLLVIILWCFASFKMCVCVFFLLADHYCTRSESSWVASCRRTEPIDTWFV